MLCRCETEDQFWSNTFERSLTSEEDGGDDENGTTTEFEDSTILLNTLIVYGVLFVVVILLFSWLRRRYPVAFNTRSWVPHIKTNLADEQYGFISWIWELYSIDEEVIVQECGVDATCFLRLIHLGYRLSLFGLLTSIFLLPVYFTSKESPGTSDVNDWVVETTLSHVPSGSNRLYATVVASYLFFFYAMYLIVGEIKWFTSLRHNYLRKPFAGHLAVFVRNIPSELEIDNATKLEAFFSKCFSADAVLKAFLPVTVANLEQAIAERDKTLSRLERSLALFKKSGQRPHHKEDILGLSDQELDSIQFYSELLERQNQDVANRMAAIEGKDNRGAKSIVESNSTKRSTTGDDFFEQPNQDNKTKDNWQLHPELGLPGLAATTVEVTTTAATRATAAATHLAVQAVRTAAELVLRAEDGIPYSAGFVVFTKLSSTNAALQMNHYRTPYKMRILEAPDPADVRWENVGRTHEDLQAGKLTSIALTVSLCLAWTIPTSFLASLSNVRNVREEFEFLDDLFNKYPKLIPFVELVAPLLLIALNSSLPVIFTLITKFEGHIGFGTLQASKFVKLASFAMVQTFYVSALSGSLSQAISSILEEPSKAIELLASTIPSQGTYLMQLAIIYTVQNSAFELLRLFPLGYAWVRSFVGPNTTEKDKTKKFAGFIRPLSDPLFFQQAIFASQLVLFFTILFVYTVIYPLSPIIMMICFLFWGSMYRHQFVYIYPTNPESGGKLWLNFMQFVLAAMVVAQLTILGILGLNTAPTQASLFFPLPCITILFILYLHQMHFRVAAFLPSHVCVAEDKNRGADFDYSFLGRAFLQPALMAELDVQPDPSLISEDRIVEA